MKNKRSNRWSKQENQRRYYLHQKIKGNFYYSAMQRVVYVPNGFEYNTCCHYSKAISELGKRFQYNVQTFIAS